MIIALIFMIATFILTESSFVHYKKKIADLEFNLTIAKHKINILNEKNCRLKKVIKKLNKKQHEEEA